MSMRVLYRAIWIPSALVLAGSMVAFALKPVSFPEPGPLVSYSLDDQSLSLKHPQNWKPAAMSSHSVASEVRFNPAKGILFVATADLKGALMADVARSNQSQAENLAGMAGSPGGEGTEQSETGVDSTGTPPGGAAGPVGGATAPPGGEGLLGSILGGGGASTRKSPLEQLHEAGAAEVSEQLQEYKEQKPAKTRIAGLDALVSDYTATVPGALGGKPVQGKRYTAIGQERAISVRFHCPEGARTKLEPLFKEMAASVASGEGRQP
jgi:hypothetical protein